MDCHKLAPTAGAENQPTLKDRLLEAGASALQGFLPVSQICAHLCALHAYSTDISRQIIAHHYCTHLTKEIHQCIIYDSPEKDARLIGVEYLISLRLYETLDPEEKMLWHSHNYEVMSGMLSLPGVPEIAEREVMKEIGNCYGKIISTWQVDRDPLPLGPPRLMVSLTNDDVVDKTLLPELERRTGVKMEERKKAREGTVFCHEKPKEVDAWERGEKIDFEVTRRRGSV